MGSRSWLIWVGLVHGWGMKSEADGSITFARDDAVLYVKLDRKGRVIWIGSPTHDVTCKRGKADKAERFLKGSYCRDGLAERGTV